MSATAETTARLFGLVQPNRLTQGITNRELARLLREAAKEAAEIVARAAGGSVTDAVTLVRAIQVQQALAQLSAQLWNDIGSVTREGMYEQAQLAAKQALELDTLLGMPSAIVEQYADLIYFDASQSVNSLISRHTNGFTLSDRIYANGRVTTNRVGRIIDKALAKQSSWRELAHEVREHFKPNVPGGTSYAAKRLARTEINNAHHETTIRLAERKPWVLGFKWTLSSSHPKPDPCDDLAHADNGMGEGVYPKDSVPRRPHPQCLCYVTHIQEDDELFVKKLANGEYDSYIQGR